MASESRVSISPLIDVMIAAMPLLPVLSGRDFRLSPAKLWQCPPETSRLLCSSASSDSVKSEDSPERVLIHLQESVEPLPTSCLLPSLAWELSLLPRTSAGIPAHWPRRCCQPCRACADTCELFPDRTASSLIGLGVPHYGGSVYRAKIACCFKTGFCCDAHDGLELTV